MAVKKPCAKCYHAKTRHRRHECRETGPTTGAAFMGTRMATKWCLCDGYLDPTGPEKNTTQTHAARPTDQP